MPTPAISPWTEATFLGVFRTLRPVSSYFLDLCFPRVYFSTTKYIDLGDIPEAKRILAPFVMPTTGGKPTYTGEETARRFAPPYMKPKDAITDAQMASRQAGLGEMYDPTPMTPQARFDASVAAIVKHHQDIIYRRMEWMAAQAIRNSTVTMEGEGYPTQVVNFGRAANQDVTLGASATWDNDDAPILDNVEEWSNIMATATVMANGGPTRMTVGANVAKVMKNNPTIRALLSQLTNAWAGGLNLNLGINTMNADTRVTFLGMLSPSLPVYMNADVFIDPKTGEQANYVDPNEIILTGQVEGIKAFGRIIDKKAQFANMPIFTKMFDEEDPGVTNILSQSAPLPIPLYPNATFRAKVLAS